MSLQVGLESAHVNVGASANTTAGASDTTIPSAKAALSAAENARVRALDDRDRGGLGLTDDSVDIEALAVSSGTGAVTDGRPAGVDCRRAFVPCLDRPLPLSSVKRRIRIVNARKTTQWLHDDRVDGFTVTTPSMLPDGRMPQKYCPRGDER